MASMSPPVLRSMTASAPYFTAIFSFSISASRSTMSLDVPRLTLIFTDSPSPMAAGSAPWTGLWGAHMRPDAIPFLMNSGLTFSFSAICFIRGVTSPLRATSMMVLIVNRACIGWNRLLRFHQRPGSSSMSSRVRRSTSLFSRPSSNPALEQMTYLRTS